MLLLKNVVTIPIVTISGSLIVIILFVILVIGTTEPNFPTSLHRRPQLRPS